VLEAFFCSNTSRNQKGPAPAKNQGAEHKKAAILIEITASLNNA
jgi:hypothetical protein